jgi:acetylornithine deacetylase/succinyl-diaminopimelate desuccinylase-like protein
LYWHLFYFSAVAPALLLRIPLVGLFLAAGVFADSTQEKVRAYRQANERALIDEHIQFVSIPDVGADAKNARRNAEFIAAMMEHRGIPARLLEAKTHGVNPVVYGEIKVPGAKRTLLLYAHYDGQPVNPSEWAPGLEPFSPKFITAPIEHGGTIICSWKSGDPVNPDWRLTGRASADDKAGIMCILGAYEALAKTGVSPSANIKFFFEGEEEVSSPHLKEFLDANKDLLQADLWIICDGPRDVFGRKMAVFGVRGDIGMGLTVYGPKRPLHSGHYGNWAPNPAWLLVDLLASMKDLDGHVLIKGFYDDVQPLNHAEQDALAAIPNPDPILQKELGIAQPEVPGRSLIESLQIPSLNIKGIQSANIGPIAANVIPVSAKAALDLRLVLGNDSHRQVEKVLEHIKSQGFTVIDHEPTDEERSQIARLIRVDIGSGYNAQRTSLDLPEAKAVAKAIQATASEPVILLPSMGASLPLIVIERTLGTRIITVPVANYDDNQHAENENLKVQYLWDGMETYAALMTMAW